MQIDSFSVYWVTPLRSKIIFQNSATHIRMRIVSDIVILKKMLSFELSLVFKMQSFSGTIFFSNSYSYSGEKKRWNLTSVTVLARTPLMSQWHGSNCGQKIVYSQLVNGNAMLGLYMYIFSTLWNTHLAKFTHVPIVNTRSSWNDLSSNYNQAWGRFRDIYKLFNVVVITPCHLVRVICLGVRLLFTTKY